jgi:Tol biopolymer transport system component
MRRIPLLLFALVLTIAAVTNLAQDASSPELRAADILWNDGQYIQALTAYIKLLASPGGDRYLEPIALQTGELFVTEELTTDGRSPRLSPDGRFITYEAGPEKNPVTRVLRTEGKHESVAELPGTGAVFSPNGSLVAYIQTFATPELTRAQEALDKASTQGAERTFAQQTLARLQSRMSQIVLRDLVSRQETILNTDDLLKSNLAFAPDNQTVYFVGASESDSKRNDIYAVTATSSAPVAVTEAEGFKTAPIVAATGQVMIVSLPNQTPFPVPQPPSENGDRGAAGGARGGAGGGQRGGAGGPGGVPARFGLVDLTTHKITVINGATPAFSDDGKALAYATTSGADNMLMLLPVGGTATTVLKTTDRLTAPAFSPDGSKITYQRMLRDDWEIFYINTDGKNELRVTREIQHDVLPRFLTKDRILAEIGEPRHRRSYIYDIPSMTRTRVFHNNTVRTLAPEYSWMPSPDGSRILISAERDGDTISPERGVYLVDLNRKITKADLNARLQMNLTSETLLKEFGQRIFDPIAGNIRQIVAQVSTSSIYSYEQNLTSFGSRHISQPGNRKASEWLFEEFKSFGYQPDYQWFEPRGALDGKSANVIARLKGTENPELIYTISSHYDSVVAGPGADDDASGIAALLDAARVLAGHPQPATIIFCAFTGEESGDLGSREFARVAKEGKWKIVGGLNNDMVGWSNDNRLDNTIRYSNSGIRDIQHAAAMNFSRLITYDAHWYKGTDAAALFEAFGDIMGGMGGYPVLGTPHYHTATDVLDTLNFEQIAESSKMTIASIMYLASAPSPVRDLSVKGTQVTWTPSPEKGVTSYILSHGGREQKVTVSRATVTGLKTGDAVRVRAVNSRGMQGWDWARSAAP